MRFNNIVKQKNVIQIKIETKPANLQRLTNYYPVLLFVYQ